MLGQYGENFGAPRYAVRIRNGKIRDLNVLRGAPCGATWEAAKKVVGSSVDEAAVRIGLKTQMYCVADPAGWDPISGKSPVHIAGELHSAALKAALAGTQED